LTLNVLEDEAQPAPVVPAADKSPAPSQPTSRSAALAGAIDRYSRAVFPLIFLAFNVIYWAIYLTISARPKETDFVFFDWRHFCVRLSVCPSVTLCSGSVCGLKVVALSS